MNRAVLYLLLAVGIFSIINVGVKFLSHLPATEIVLFRGVVSFILCAYFIWRKKKSFLGKNKKLLFARGFFGTIALLSLFLCLQKIPLAVAMTLIGLTPIMTVIIAHFYLKEKAEPRQWGFLLLSFLGVALVRGGVEPVSWLWMGVGLGAAFFAALAYTCVRELRTTEDPLVVILYFPLVTVPMVGPMVYFQWQTPQGLEWWILIGIGVLTQVAQYFMTLAYQMETAANVMIFNYTGLFWGIILGWVFFAETLTLTQVIGVLVVFTCLCGNYFVGLKKKGGQMTRVGPSTHVK
jgi:drug/metabolite transporter (DMT)-like permease